MKKGTIVAISEGAYSQYNIQGTYRALVDFEPEAVTKLWLEKNPIQAKRYRADFGAFVIWLQEAGYIEKFKVTEWFLGQYDDFGYSPYLREDISSRDWAERDVEKLAIETIEDDAE